MKKILLPISLLLISTIVHAKMNADSVPQKTFGDLSSMPGMQTTFNAGTKSISIQASYKNGTQLYAKKINDNLVEVKINGNKVASDELPAYSAEVIRLEDLHALHLLSAARIYRLDAATNEFVKMHIDYTLLGIPHRPDQPRLLANTLSPAITAKLITEVKNDSTQNPYKAYVVDLQTNEVTVLELSRNESLKLSYANKVIRKRAD